MPGKNAARWCLSCAKLRPEEMFDQYPLNSLLKMKV